MPLIRANKQISGSWAPKKYSYLSDCGRPWFFLECTEQPTGRLTFPHQNCTCGFELQHKTYVINSLLSLSFASRYSTSVMLMQSYRTTNTPPKEPCVFFARNACKSGDFCRFAHVITPQPSTALCQFFLRGSCTYGDKCFNLHSKEGQEQSISRALIVCKYYLQGECRNGSSCPYRHDKGSFPEIHGSDSY